MSDGPDLLERARMALTDCGEDPGQIIWHPLKPGILALPNWSEMTPIVWRAAELARAVDPSHRQRCWACVHADPFRWRDDCRAALPLTEDCGIDRGPS